MSHHHHPDAGIGGVSDPFQIASVLIEADGRCSVEFTTERPHHRHFNMSFQQGEDPTLDKAIVDIGEALVPCAVKAMMDMLTGLSSVPSTAAELVGPLWHCRICDATAPAGSEGWVANATDGGPLKQYCPEHAVGRSVVCSCPDRSCPVHINGNP